MLTQHGSRKAFRPSMTALSSILLLVVSASRPKIYTRLVPAREAVEKLSRLVTNGDEFVQIAEELPMLTGQIQ